MFEKVAVFEKRYEEIEQLLCQPQTVQDTARYTALLRESSEITPLVQEYRCYRQAVEREEQARELLREPGLDKEMEALAQEELAAGRAEQAERAKQLNLLLLPRDPNDEKPVIVEIRAGAGGEEAALFSAVLFRMYSMYAEKKGWTSEVISCNETELGGYKEICFSVDGASAYSLLKFESGVHRVQRVPETETQGRVHTSTATVAVLPQVDEVTVQIDPKDLQIDTFRSSGAGGQHINKTSSAIRITHLPTGLVVECQDERSQYKNKEKALKVLRSRLFEKAQKKQDEALAADRRSQVGTGDRSERIRTYNFPQGRVTDHRIGLTLYRIDSFINGEIQEVLDALIAADQAEKLRQAAGMENE